LNFQKKKIWEKTGVEENIINTYLYGKLEQTTENQLKRQRNKSVKMLRYFLQNKLGSTNQMPKGSKGLDLGNID